MIIDKNNRILVLIKEFVYERFDLSEDKANEQEIVELIKKGVEFRGTNLWVLIFAIFIASIGLNVNSTAVVIGAMLISPLMGPIMGIGLGIGINDFQLIKKAYKNLGIAVIISVIASTTYFFISPLSDAQSELLARTTPTIWDVLIALFGGLAGIVAATRKSSSNVVPGVAIATALMPPLCTAGFGLATGNFYYFIGAFYLFFINSVFISLSAFIIVRFLKFKKSAFVDSVAERRVRRSILIVVIITVIPSLVMAYNIVNQSIFERNANRFIAYELNFENSQIVSRNISYKGEKSMIEVFLLGETLEPKLIENVKSKLKNYGLVDTEFKIRQGINSEKVDINTLRTGVIEDLYRKNEELIKNKDKKITLLESELSRLKSESFPVEDLSKELKTLNKNLSEFTMNKTILTDLVKQKTDTLAFAYARFKTKPSSSEIKKLKEWLSVRTKYENIRLVIQ
ncbi:MAG: TIGR00341 family protein [Ignavibacteriales bacterium]|nr:TIGR00341 family protein [Ignavibacteriales bacterium]